MDVIFLKSLRPLYCDYISRILCVRRAQQGRPPRPPFMYFYSRPYARGDSVRTLAISSTIPISTHAPTRGATSACGILGSTSGNFYSRPYTRGDEHDEPFYLSIGIFLLPPLREGRHFPGQEWGFRPIISTHAPTREATGIFSNCVCPMIFLLAPLREGRPA